MKRQTVTERAKQQYAQSTSFRN